MSKFLLSLTVVAVLALAVTSCESTGNIAARTQEKSAVYAALKPWEKKIIGKGSVAVGFTPDMVYMALGHPTKTTKKDFPEGSAALWTYSRVYPNAESIRGFKHVVLTLESAYQPQHATEPPVISNLPVAGPKLENTSHPPARSATQSIAQSGPPQGTTMEPADLGSYVIQVLFENDQVARLSAVPNSN